MNFGQLEGGWICVYVPEGTTPNKPFPDLETDCVNFTLYEPNQYVLGHGTWLEDGEYYQLNDTNTVTGSVTLVISATLILLLITMFALLSLSQRNSTLAMLKMICYAKKSTSVQVSDVSIEGCEANMSYVSEAN